MEERRGRFARLAAGPALAVLVWAAACAAPGSPLGDEASPPAVNPGVLTPAAGTPLCVALRAGTQAVGQVCLREERGELVVDYTALGARRLRSTAVAVADDPAGFPLTSNGTIDISRFPSIAQHADVPTYAARLSLGGSVTRPGARIYVAAYAVVLDGKKQKAAWGDGAPFPRGGTYIAFDRPRRSAFIVVGDVAASTTSERRMQTRLGELGYDARMMGEAEFSVGAVTGCDVVLIAQTVSNAIGARPKPLPCGILFWDDNSQRIDFLATIRNDGSNGTAWHRSDTLMYVIPDAPAELRAGLSGPVRFYTRSDEIAWAPRADLPANATRIANSRHAEYNPAIYYYDRGESLADGTPAAGRRIFFGLTRDSFRVLTPEGRALFEAALDWAAR